MKIEWIWLTKLFNKILRIKKTPDEWRKSFAVLIYKNLGNIQNCTSYHGNYETMQGSNGAKT